MMQMQISQWWWMLTDHRWHIKIDNKCRCHRWRWRSVDKTLRILYRLVHKQQNDHERLNTYKTRSDCSHDVGDIRNNEEMNDDRSMMPQ
jgi:hypothetical protein